MAYVLVSKGVVIQKSYKDREGFEEAPDHVVCGFLKVGRDFVAPAPDPNAAIESERRAADQAAVDLVKADATIAYLRAHTPAECYNKMQTDVTTLAEAKQMMGRFAMALCVLTKRM